MNTVGRERVLTQCRACSLRCQLWFFPQSEFLEAAVELEADLIVFGVRGASGHLSAATHLERTTAHKVVADAPCPVLTVPG
jgi:nucleotide-binding universal stress UspA family protein